MSLQNEYSEAFLSIKELVSDHIELVAFGKGSFKEATERATKFLIVVSLLADHRLQLERQKAKVTTMRDAFYATAMGQAEGKTVTEKKLAAEMEVNYTNHRELVEEIDAEISWVKAHLEIFNNAHVTYRQMSRGE